MVITAAKGFRRLPALVALVAALGVATSTPGLASPDVFVVTTTADAGPGSLRAAILEANAHANPPGGADEVHFAIPGPPPYTIQVASDLPAVTDPVEIDGTTQTGFPGSPIVELHGAAYPATFTGLAIQAGSSTVRGLVINGFQQGIALSRGDENLIEGSFIGIDVSGEHAVSGSNFGIVTFETSPSSRNTIARNVIAGNVGGNVFFEHTSAGNRVVGNNIGTNASGTAALGGPWGVLARGPDNVIGGTDRADRNVISGNGTGVLAEGPGTTVLGNFIGTDVTGTVALGNGTGIESTASGQGGVTIGGTAGTSPGGSCTGACNLISGNTSFGVTHDAGAGALESRIQGNRIGTDVTGTEPLGNGLGVNLGSNTLLGGTTASARNVISANLNAIPGRVAGVYVGGSGNRIQGNFIGTDRTGAGSLGNMLHGISVSGDGNSIGGPGEGAGNVIAFNGFSGVRVEWTGGAFGPSSANAILGNSIFSNGASPSSIPGLTLGIDLTPIGATPNDSGDMDTGPNGLQNFPVITDVSVSGGTTTVRGMLDSEAGRSYRVELFNNDACDPDDHHGQGQTLLGATDVTTDGSGRGTFSTVFSTVVAADEVVTATATPVNADTFGGTSEFLPCRADLSVAKSDDPDPAVVGETVTYKLDIANAGPAPAADVTVVDTLPEGVTFVSATPTDSCRFDLSSRTVTCSLGMLARGGSASVTIDVTPTVPGTITNRAVVSSELNDPDPDDNGDSEDTVVKDEQVEPARLVVDKVTVPAGEPQLFDFSLAGGSVEQAFQLGDASTPHDSGDLEPGTYRISETVPAGWDQAAPTCSDGSPATAIELDAGETVTCTFTNTKRGSVTLKKTTNGIVDPSMDILFVLTGPGLPTAGVTRSTFGDQDGVLEWVNLIPNQTHKICETPVPAGFTSFWKLDGVIVTPYNPDASQTPPEDLGTRCYDFSVSPGQARAFEVDNSRPGGDPRTIGYWKNWNRCTGGNHSATAAKNGGAAAGFFLVEDLLPQLIGDFSVTSCQQAVRLLSKQDQSGRNKASDAAYELGAQLLAARFNLAAGAETCPAVQQAVLSGQTLLDGIGLTGSGDYLGSKSKDPRRQQAIALASTIDRYNNGNLC